MRVDGVVRPPGDKSVSHRALMIAALADGTSVLRRLAVAADVASTGSVLGALGAPIVSDDCAMVVAGRGRGGLRAPAGDLDCGNSGTTTRLVAGMVAAHPMTTRFTGDASLSRRPMRRIAQPLREMGASIELTGDRLPMTIRGGDMRPVEWRSTVASAQVKSSILLAAFAAGIDARVVEPMPSRDHTERMLRQLGVPVSSGSHPDGWSVAIQPVERIGGFTIDVPADPSSGAFFAGLAAIAAAGEIGVSDLLWNPLRIGAFTVLRRMGVHVDVGSVAERFGEPVAETIRVAPGQLRATAIDGAEVPALLDEIPLLACVAARAEGTTTIRGAEELRVKESDRIAAIVRNLRAIGVRTAEYPDGLDVTGTDEPLAGRVVTEGDHRIAMAFGVLAADPRNSIEVDDRECVGISYPGFWRDLSRVSGS